MSETQEKAAARPKTADGTADWEVIFEDPANGLIPLVAQATSHKILRACMSVVIDKLFIRQHDHADRDRLILLLNKLTDESSGGDVSAAKDGVINLLRDIKTQRMTKAAQHIAMENKAKRKNPRHTRERRRASGRNWAPIILASVIGLAAVALVAVLFVLSQGSGGSSVESKAAARVEQERQHEEEVAAQIRANRVAEEKGKREKAEADKVKAKEAAIKAAEDAAAVFPRNIFFEQVYWRGGVGDKKAKPRYFQPYFMVADANQLARICGSLPWLKESINLSLGRLSSGSASERAGAAKWLGDRINARIGKSTVSDVGILAAGDAGFRTKAHRCRRAPPPQPAE